MSQPNYYPPDIGYHVIGWFREGRYFAVPERDVIDAFLTICAKASANYDVGIAAWALMSSHPHMFVFDRDPDGPSRVWEFKRFVHGIFAQWLNWRWSTSGKVFDPNVLSQQFAILDIREEENQIQYIENNMLAAGIIDFDGRLEGAVSKRDYLLEPLVIERPSSWFQARTWPDTATIQLEVPPKAKAAGFTRETWWSSTRVSTYLAQMEAFERRLASGKRLRFVDEVLAESPHRPRKTKISHRRIPCASSEKLRRAVFRRKRLGFLRQYRRSMEQLAEGLADVMFPWGTCLMTSCHGLPMHAKAG